MMKTVEVVIKHPDRYSILDVEWVARKYGDIEPDSRRLETAKLFAFACCTCCLAPVAVRIIKVPPKEYTLQMFTSAKVSSLLVHKIIYETGYSATVPEMRNMGLSTLLLKTLIEDLYPMPIYSTTRISNVAVHRVLTKCGFERIGRPFQGTRENVILWLKSHHIGN